MKEYLLVGGPRDGERIKSDGFGRRFNIAFEDRIIRYKPLAWAHGADIDGMVLLEENIPVEQLIPMLIEGYRQPVRSLRPEGCTCINLPFTLSYGCPVHKRNTNLGG